MSKHTAGPWSFQEGDGRVFAERYLVGLGMGAGIISIEEIMANVRLMAAAPDLLAALKRCKQAMPDDEDLEAAQIAIDKAERRTP